jgi:hypothetical protein
MNKKGLTQTELAVIIIASVSFILLLTIIIPMITSMKAKGALEVCRESISLHNRLAGNTLNTVDTGIECPATHYTIKESRKDAIFSNIANQLTDCWYKSLGRNNNLYQSGILPTSDKDYCIVCSSFQIEEAGRIKGSINAQEFAQYLYKLDPKSKRPYVESLSTDWYSNDNSQYFVDVSKDSGNIYINPLNSIDVSSKDKKIRYLVTYVAYSDGGWFNSQDLVPKDWDIQYTPKETSSTIKTVATVAGGIAGNIASRLTDRGVSYHVLVTPENKVKNLNCYLFWDKENEKS